MVLFPNCIFNLQIKDGGVECGKDVSIIGFDDLDKKGCFRF